MAVANPPASRRTKLCVRYRSPRWQLQPPVKYRTNVVTHSWYLKSFNGAASRAKNVVKCRTNLAFGTYLHSGPSPQCLVFAIGPNNGLSINMSETKAKNLPNLACIRYLPKSKRCQLYPAPAPVNTPNWQLSSYSVYKSGSASDGKLKMS